MKRFFCTVCQKVKRVRHYPASVADKYATNPGDRVGQCDRHVVSSRVETIYRRKVGA